MNGKSEVTEYYSGLFTGNIEKITGGSSEVINSFRSKAFERFSELGIPGKKDEAYKYTNLDLFFKHDYKTYFIPGEEDFRKAEDFRCDVADLDTHGIVPDEWILSYDKRKTKGSSRRGCLSEV